MFKYIFTLIFLVSTFSAADTKIDNQVLYVSGEDRDMSQAIEQAQSTLDDFLAKAKNPPLGSSHFKLKVRLSDGNGVEHLWFIPFKEIDGGYKGALANEPEVVTSAIAGNIYVFKREQITDWGYELDGKQIGSFTVCVLFKSMDKEVVEKYKKDHGFDCQS